MSLVHFDSSFVTVNRLLLVKSVVGCPVICCQFCFSLSISHLYSVSNSRLRFSGVKIVHQLS